MDEFSVKGKWWLPRAPNDKSVGALTFHPLQGVMLNIEDNCLYNLLRNSHEDLQANNPRPRDFRRLVREELICGITTSREIYTLYDCYIEIHEISKQISIVAPTIFKGRHFETADQIAFEEYRLRFSYLREWVGKLVFTRTQTDALDKNAHTLSVEYTSIEPIQHNIDDLKLSICFNYDLDDAFYDIALYQTNYLSIKPSIPLHFEEFHRQTYYYLKNFLCLGIDEPIQTIELTGINKNTKPNNEIEIFHWEEQSDNSKEHIDPLYNYEDLSLNLDVYLHNWFSKSEALRPIFEIYFGMMYQSFTPPNLEFLLCTQALEGYYHRLYDDSYISEKDYKKIKKRMMGIIDSDSTIDMDLKKNISDSLIYAYQFSFRKKLNLILNDILKEYGDTVDMMAKDRNDFITKIVQTRNYLTHYPKKRQNKVITDLSELRVYASKMKLMLKLCFLVEMGIEPKIVKNIINRNWRISRTKHM